MARASVAPVSGGRQRTWSPPWPCPAGPILRSHRRGAGDPTFQTTPDGRYWRAFRTPEGSVTLSVLTRPTEGIVDAEAWGEGAEWALEQLPQILDAEDDPEGFEPPVPLIGAWQRHRHWRLSKPGLVWESLAPTIIEQKVTGQEAFAAFRQLVLRFGEPAPGPGSWRSDCSRRRPRSCRSRRGSGCASRSMAGAVARCSEPHRPRQLSNVPRTEALPSSMLPFAASLAWAGGPAPRCGLVPLATRMRSASATTT